MNEAIKNPSIEQVHAVLTIVSAVGNAIRELREIPSGHLYARLMAYCSLRLDQYEAIIETLKRTKMVKEENNLLIWIGPVKENEETVS